MIPNKEDIVYRKGMTEAEHRRAQKETMEEHVRSHAAEGAFAGFMLFMILARYFFRVDSWQTGAIIGGVGALFGGIIGIVEALVREKSIRANKPQSKTPDG